MDGYGLVSLLRIDLLGLLARYELAIYVSVGLFYIVFLVIPLWSGLLQVEFPALIVPLVTFVLCLMLYVLNGKFSHGRSKARVTVRVTLWFSSAVFAFVVLAGVYWYLIQYQQGTSLFHVSAQAYVQFVSDQVDKSIQGVLVGTLFGISISAIVPISVGIVNSLKSRKLIPWSATISPLGNDFTSGVVKLLKDTSQFGALPLVVIYYYSWPEKMLICEPGGFPVFADAFVGLLFLATIVPGILRYCDPSGSFAKWIKRRFTWREWPGTIISLVSAMIGFYVLLMKGLAFWSDCFVKTSPAPVPFTAMLFLLFSTITMGPAFFAILSSSIFIEVVAFSYSQISSERLIASGISAVIAIVLVVLPLPYYTNFTELLFLAFHYVAFSSLPWMPALYRYGQLLLPLATALLVVSVLIIHGKFDGGKLARCMLSTVIVFVLFSSMIQYTIGLNGFETVWILLLTTLDLTTLILVLPLKKLTEWATRRLHVQKPRLKTNTSLNHDY